MAVLKSRSRSSSPLQTTLGPVRVGATAPHQDQTCPLPQRERGEVELRKVSLRGLVSGSSSSSLPGYNESVQLPKPKGQLLLFYLLLSSDKVPLESLSTGRA